ncbi:hypothetical protein LMG28688_07108 [Paraburkholderia caffeinitolerans]|uniref:Uncharacterized protein n=1 Tax=Paraburkholderia caffeinitolerans TaxID=1723730 RepID=A0A6J5H360_9BURK|nr:hypothetical protein LMG28688_07108 [Paraburkholderia caffeinitolerans]
MNALTHKGQTNELASTTSIADADHSSGNA